jgi:hypothetical protein
MPVPTRPPPSVLLIHDGNSLDRYVIFLKAAGLEAMEAHARLAVVQAVEVRPDVIVLDFDCNGVVMRALQEDKRTRDIPVIGLARPGALRNPNAYEPGHSNES